MGRKSTEDVLQRLLDAVTVEPMPLGEIVADAETDYNVGRRYLSVLADCNLVREWTDGNERLFYRPKVSDRQMGLKLRDILSALHEGKHVQAYVQVEQLLMEIEGDSVKRSDTGE